MDINSPSCPCSPCVNDTNSTYELRRDIERPSKIDKLYLGMYLPMRERKLLERLRRTIVEYEGAISGPLPSNSNLNSRDAKIIYECCRSCSCQNEIISGKRRSLGNKDSRSHTSLDETHLKRETKSDPCTCLNKFHVASKMSTNAPLVKENEYYSRNVNNTNFLGTHKRCLCTLRRYHLNIKRRITSQISDTVKYFSSKTEKHKKRCENEIRGPGKCHPDECTRELLNRIGVYRNVSTREIKRLSTKTGKSVLKSANERSLQQKSNQSIGNSDKNSDIKKKVPVLSIKQENSPITNKNVDDLTKVHHPEKMNRDIKKEVVKPVRKSSATSAPKPTLVKNKTEYSITGKKQNKSFKRDLKSNKKSQVSQKKYFINKRHSLPKYKCDPKLCILGLCDSSKCKELTDTFTLKKNIDIDTLTLKDINKRVFGSNTHTPPSSDLQTIKAHSITASTRPTNVKKRCFCTLSLCQPPNIITNTNRISTGLTFNLPKNKRNSNLSNFEGKEKKMTPSHHTICTNTNRPNVKNVTELTKINRRSTLNSGTSIKRMKNYTNLLDTRSVKSMTSKNNSKRFRQRLKYNKTKKKFRNVVNFESDFNIGVDIYNTKLPLDRADYICPKGPHITDGEIINRNLVRVGSILNLNIELFKQCQQEKLRTRTASTATKQCLCSFEPCTVNESVEGPIEIICSQETQTPKIKGSKCLTKTSLNFKSVDCMTIYKHLETKQLRSIKIQDTQPITELQKIDDDEGCDKNKVNITSDFKLGVDVYRIKIPTIDKNAVSNEVNMSKDINLITNNNTTNRDVVNVCSALNLKIEFSKKIYNQFKNKRIRYARPTSSISSVPIHKVYFRKCFSKLGRQQNGQKISKTLNKEDKLENDNRSHINSKKLKMSVKRYLCKSKYCQQKNALLSSKNKGSSPMIGNSNICKILSNVNFNLQFYIDRTVSGKCESPILNSKYLTIATQACKQKFPLQRCFCTLSLPKVHRSVGNNFRRHASESAIEDKTINKYCENQCHKINTTPCTSERCVKLSQTDITCCNESVNTNKKDKYGTLFSGTSKAIQCNTDKCIDLMSGSNILPYECEPPSTCTRIEVQCDAIQCNKLIKARNMREIYNLNRTRSIKCINKSCKSSQNTQCEHDRSGNVFCQADNIQRSKIHCNNIIAASNRRQTKCRTNNESNSTNKTKIPKRCFCTLSLCKPSNKQCSTNAKATQYYYKPNISRQARCSATDMGSNIIHNSQGLLPFVCEPNICIPDECNPIECEKNIRARDRTGIISNIYTNYLTEENHVEKIRYNNEGIQCCLLPCDHVSNSSKACIQTKRSKSLVLKRHKKYSQTNLQCKGECILTKGSIKKRCFCTLALPPKINKTYKLPNVSTQCKKPPCFSLERKNMSIATSFNCGQEYNELLPFECEPNICIPGQWNPLECERLIKMRQKMTHSRHLGTNTAPCIVICTPNKRQNREIQYDPPCNNCASIGYQNQASILNTLVNNYGKSQTSKYSEINCVTKSPSPALNLFSPSKAAKKLTLKKCFCTLSLHKPAKLKKYVNKSTIGCQYLCSLLTTPLTRNTAIITDETYQQCHNELLPFECEPNICVPSECNPVECEKLIRARENPNRLKQLLYKPWPCVTQIYDENKICLNEQTQCKLCSCIPSFNPRFIKGSNKRDAQISGNVNKGTRNMDEEMCCTDYKLRQLNSSQTDAQYANEATFINQKPYSKKCFCTLNLYKAPKRKNEVHRLTISTQCRVPHKTPMPKKTNETATTFNIYTTDKCLLPYECEPNICIPGACDPIKCDNLIRERVSKSIKHICRRIDCYMAYAITSQTFNEQTKHAKNFMPFGEKETIISFCKNHYNFELDQIKCEDHNGTVCKVNSGNIIKRCYCSLNIYKDGKPEEVDYFSRQITSPIKKYIRGTNNLLCKPNLFSAKYKRNYNDDRNRDLMKTGFSRLWRNTECYSMYVTKEKIESINKSTSGRKTNEKLRRGHNINLINKLNARHQQSGDATKSDKSFSLKRCFCIIDIQRKFKSKSDKEITKVSQSKNIQSDPNFDITSNTKKVDFNYGYKLLPFECEPHVCITGECDPVKCDHIIKARMKKRHTKELGTVSTYVLTQSKSCQIYPECSNIDTLCNIINIENCGHKLSPRLTSLNKCPTKCNQTNSNCNNKTTVNIKRCFCTLNICKSTETNPLKNHCSVAIQCTEKLCLPKLVKTTATITKCIEIMNKYELLPFECEPGVCIPGECNPLECDILIKDRDAGKCCTESGTMPIYGSKVNSVVCVKKDLIKTRPTQSIPPACPVTFAEGCQACQITCDVETPACDDIIDNCGFETAPCVVPPKILCQPIDTQTENTCVTKATSIVPKSLKESCFCTLSLRKPCKPLKTIKPCVIAVQCLEPPNIPTSVKTTATITKCIEVNNYRDLLPFECEPSVSMPGECNPHDCNVLIKAQNVGKSHTGSDTMSLCDPKVNNVVCIKKDIIKTRPTQSIPPAYPVTLAEGCQASQITCNVKTPACDGIIDNCGFEKAPRVVPPKILCQPTLTQTENTCVTEATSIVPKYLRNRCYCTLSLRKKSKPIKVIKPCAIAVQCMEPPIISTSVKTTATNMKCIEVNNYRDLLSFECEPGVCMPGECNPHECNVLIKAQNIGKSYMGSDTMSLCNPKVNNVVCVKKDIIKTRPTQSIPPAGPVTLSEGCQACPITCNVETPACEGIIDNCGFEKAPRVVPPKILCQPTLTQTENTCVTEATSIVPKTLKKRCFCTLSLRKPCKAVKSIKPCVTAVQCLELPNIPTSVKNTATVTKCIEVNNYRDLLPLECEPGICMPGKCSPHECDVLIKARNVGKSCTGSETMPICGPKVNDVVCVKKDIMKTCPTQSNPPACPVTFAEGCQACQITCNIEIPACDDFIDNCGFETAPPKILCQPTVTQTENTCITEASSSVPKPLKKRCFCTLSLRKPCKPVKTIKPCVIAVQCLEPPNIPTSVKTTATITKCIEANNHRDLLPLDCEPSVCMPGECNPHECDLLIKSRNVGKSCTGSDTMSLYDPKVNNVVCVKKDMMKTRPTQSTPPACPVTLAEGCQACQITCNVETPACECIIDNCGFQTAPRVVPRKILCQTTVTQTENTFVTEATSIVPKSLKKRCFCTLSLRKPCKPVKTIKPCVTAVQCLEPTTIPTSVKTRGTITKCMENKNDRDLLPFECEPGVCMPGECNPHECDILIKAREGGKYCMELGTMPVCGPKVSSVVCVKKDIIKTRPTQSVPPAYPVTLTEGCQACQISCNIEKPVCDDIVDNCRFVAAPCVVLPKISCQPTITQTDNTCVTKATSTVPKCLKKRCFCTLSLRKPSKPLNVIKARAIAVQCTELPSIPTSLKTTATITECIEVKNVRDLLAFECEPGVCMPGECNPHECDILIKTREGGKCCKESGTMPVCGPKVSSVVCVKKDIIKTRPTQSVPPAYPVTLSEGCQAYRISCNVEKPVCDDIVDNCKFESAPCVVLPKISCQPTITQTDNTCVTEATSTVPKCLKKRCFCTFNLRKPSKPVNATKPCAIGVQCMESPSISTPVKTTSTIAKFTDMKNVCDLMPFECEPGVCIPGECKPQDCDYMIKARGLTKRHQFGTTTSIAAKSKKFKSQKTQNTLPMFPPSPSKCCQLCQKNSSRDCTVSNRSRKSNVTQTLNTYNYDTSTTTRSILERCFCTLNIRKHRKIEDLHNDTKVGSQCTTSTINNFTRTNDLMNCNGLKSRFKSGFVKTKQFKDFNDAEDLKYNNRNDGRFEMSNCKQDKLPIWKIHVSPINNLDAVNNHNSIKSGVKKSKSNASKNMISTNVYVCSSGTKRSPFTYNSYNSSILDNKSCSNSNFDSNSCNAKNQNLKNCSDQELLVNPVHSENWKSTYNTANKVKAAVKRCFYTLNSCRRRNTTDRNSTPTQNDLINCCKVRNYNYSQTPAVNEHEIRTKINLKQHRQQPIPCIKPLSKSLLKSQSNEAGDVGKVDNIGKTKPSVYKHKRKVYRISSNLKFNIDFVKERNSNVREKRQFKHLKNKPETLISDNNSPHDTDGSICDGVKILRKRCFRTINPKKYIKNISRSSCLSQLPFKAYKSKAKLPSTTSVACNNFEYNLLPFECETYICNPDQCDSVGYDKIIKSRNTNISYLNDLNVCGMGKMAEYIVNRSICYHTMDAGDHVISSLRRITHDGVTDFKNSTSRNKLCVQPGEMCINMSNNKHINYSTYTQLAKSTSQVDLLPDISYQRLNKIISKRSYDFQTRTRHYDPTKASGDLKLFPNHQTSKNISSSSSLCCDLTKHFSSTNNSNFSRKKALLNDFSKYESILRDNKSHNSGTTHNDKSRVCTEKQISNKRSNFCNIKTYRQNILQCDFSKKSKNELSTGSIVIYQKVNDQTKQNYSPVYETLNKKFGDNRSEINRKAVNTTKGKSKRKYLLKEHISRYKSHNLPESKHSKQNSFKMCNVTKSSRNENVKPFNGSKNKISNLNTISRSRPDYCNFISKALNPRICRKKNELIKKQNQSTLIVPLLPLLNPQVKENECKHILSCSLLKSNKNNCLKIRTNYSMNDIKKHVSFENLRKNVICEEVIQLNIKKCKRKLPKYFKKSKNLVYKENYLKEKNKVKLNSVQVLKDNSTLLANFTTSCGFRTYLNNTENSKDCKEKNNTNTNNVKNKRNNFDDRRITNKLNHKIRSSKVNEPKENNAVKRSTNSISHNYTINKNYNKISKLLKKNTKLKEKEHSVPYKQNKSISLDMNYNIIAPYKPIKPIQATHKSMLKYNDNKKHKSNRFSKEIDVPIQKYAYIQRSATLGKKKNTVTVINVSQYIDKQNTTLYKNKLPSKKPNTNNKVYSRLGKDNKLTTFVNFVGRLLRHSEKTGRKSSDCDYRMKTIMPYSDEKFTKKLIYKLPNDNKNINQIKMNDTTLSECTKNEIKSNLKRNSYDVNYIKSERYFHHRHSEHYNARKACSCSKCLMFRNSQSTKRKSKYLKNKDISYKVIKKVTNDPVICLRKECHAAKCITPHMTNKQRVTIAAYAQIDPWLSVNNESVYKVKCPECIKASSCELDGNETISNYFKSVWEKCQCKLISKEKKNANPQIPQNLLQISKCRNIKCPARQNEIAKKELLELIVDLDKLCVYNREDLLEKITTKPNSKKGLDKKMLEVKLDSSSLCLLNKEELLEKFSTIKKSCVPLFKPKKNFLMKPIKSNPSRTVQNVLAKVSSKPNKAKVICKQCEKESQLITSIKELIKSRLPFESSEPCICGSKVCKKLSDEKQRKKLKQKNMPLCTCGSKICKKALKDSIEIEKAMKARQDKAKELKQQVNIEKWKRDKEEIDLSDKEKYEKEKRLLKEKEIEGKIKRKLKYKEMNLKKKPQKSVQKYSCERVKSLTKYLLKRDLEEVRNIIERSLEGRKETKAEQKYRLKKEKIIAKQKHQEMLERVKNYHKADKNRRKKLIKKNKDKMKEAYRFKDSADSILITESLLDIAQWGIRKGINLGRFTYRGVTNPKCTLRYMTRKPKNPICTCDEKFSDVKTTFSRVYQRLKSTRILSIPIRILENIPGLKYLRHRLDSNPKTKQNSFKKQKEIRNPEGRFACSLFVGSLRKPKCLWIYGMCPWLYPHLINALTLCRQFTNILLFLLAAVVWTPCIFLMEALRALMCCFLCNNP